MADHGNIVEELKTPLETHAKIFEESCRGSRLVGRILADCKRGPSVDTSSHILKVLGLVSWQGLLSVLSASGRRGGINIDGLPSVVGEVEIAGGSSLAVGFGR